MLDPRLMLATDVILCEDGHAQERSLMGQILEVVRAQDLGIRDRNFCTAGSLFGIANRGAAFVVRQHASTPHRQFAGKRRTCGRVDTGRVFEQAIRATNDAGEVLIPRRVTVTLGKPKRDRETEIHVLTNVPAKDARAGAVADLYRRRWTIETTFAEREATLDGEIDTLGYPKAALFAFRVAWVSCNVPSTVKAAVRLPAYQKRPRGPKTPKPKKRSGAKIKHVATAKALAHRRHRIWCPDGVARRCPAG